MEHINRACKTAVTSLGANLTPKAIVRCMDLLMNVTHQFDKRVWHRLCTQHTLKGLFQKGPSNCCERTEKSKVFKHLPGRRHDFFNSLKGSILERMNFKSGWSTLSKGSVGQYANWVNGYCDRISMECTIILSKVECTSLQPPHSQLLLQTLQYLYFWRRWEN